MIISRICRQLSVPFIVLGLAAGCAQVKKAEHSIGVGGGVPHNAREIGATQGAAPLHLTASSGGTVYVKDANTEDVVFKGRVHAGDSITVDPASDQITAGANSQSTKLAKNHKYQAYLDPR